MLRLKRLHLQNFQSIQSLQVIDFAPITLLFGKNSAGKSVIADALQFFGDVMSGTATLQQLKRWRSSAADVSAPTKIGVGIEFDGRLNIRGLIRGLGLGELQRFEGLIEYEKHRELWTLSSLFDTKKEKNNNRKEQSKFTRLVEIIVSLNMSGDWITPNISELLVRVDNQDLVTIDHCGARVCVKLAHPALSKDFSLWHTRVDIEYAAKELEDALPVGAKSFFVSKSDETLTLNSLFMPFIGLSISPTFSMPMGTLEADKYFSNDWEDDDDPKDAPTIREKYLGKNLSESTHESVDLIRQILAGLVTYPAKICGAIAAGVLRVGPIRAIPTTADLIWNYTSSYRDTLKGHNEGYWDDTEHDNELTANPKEWGDGKAAWQVLAESEHKRIVVNTWLKQLGLPTQVVARQYKMEPSVENTYLPPRIDEDLVRVSRERERTTQPPVNYPSEKTRTNILFLIDAKTHTAVGVSDVGTGSSQVIPVLTALLETSIVRFIEQPELHLHPSMQLQLAEIVASVHSETIKAQNSAYWADKQILSTNVIETHSEHIALRCLKLVRKKGNKESAFKLSEKDLSFIYCQYTDAGTRLIEIRVDSKGRFVDQWPDGFFTERINEVF